jgi:hypothetical protein
MVTANVYIDGFSLSYRCQKGTRHKWLDVAKLALLRKCHVCHAQRA